MKDLTKGPEGKAIFIFALPMLIGSLFQQLYNTADSIIVGRFIGGDAMAAVSGANPIMFLLTSLLTGITLGFSILVSQYYGSRDMKKIKRTVDTTYIFIFTTAIIITILGVTFSGTILKLMNTPENIFLDSKNYLLIIFIGTIFSAGYNGISALLRALGDSINPLIFLIIATILNIILDIIFIIKFDMGINGVALATILAQGVSFIFSIIYLNSKHDILRINIATPKFDYNILKVGLKLGIPSGIQQMLFSIGNIAMQSLVNSYGTAAMAAFGAGTKIESFISIPIVNLGAAVSTFVAQNIGAKRIDRVEKGVKTSTFMAMGLALVVAVVFVTFDKSLITLFNSDSEIVNIGGKYLSTIGPFFITVCTSYIQISAIKGAGEALFPLISSIISLWLARIPVAYIGAYFFGVDGIWYGICFGWTLGFIITLIYYKKGTWKKGS